MGWAIPSLEDVVSHSFHISVIVLLVGGILFRFIFLLLFKRFKKNPYINVIVGGVIASIITLLIFNSSVFSTRPEFLLLLVLLNVYIVSTIYILLYFVDLFIRAPIIYKILIIVSFIGIIHFISPRLDTWTDTRVIYDENQKSQGLTIDLYKKAEVSETACSCIGVKFNFNWIKVSPIDPDSAYRDGHFCNGFPFACKTKSRIIDNYVDISPML